MSQTAIHIDVHYKPTGWSIADDNTQHWASLDGLECTIKIYIDPRFSEILRSLPGESFACRMLNCFAEK